MIAPFLATMWYHTVGWAKKHHFASYIYLLSCLALEFSLFVDISIGAPGHEKVVFDSLNARDKSISKLAIAKLLNTKIIQDYS